MNTNVGFGVFSPFGGANAFNKDFTSSFNPKTSKGMFDPLTLGLGAINAGFGFLSGQNQDATSASIAEAQLAAQNAAIQENREKIKGELASNIGNRVWQTGPGADIAFTRDMKAALFETGPLAERRLNQEIGFRRGLNALEGSAAFIDQKQRENKEALKRSLLEREGALAAAFGKIAPREVGTYFV